MCLYHYFESLCDWDEFEFFDSISQTSYLCDHSANGIWYRSWNIGSTRNLIATSLRQLYVILCVVTEIATKRICSAEVWHLQEWQTNFTISFMNERKNKTKMDIIRMSAADHVAWLIQNYTELLFQLVQTASSTVRWFELYKFKPRNQNITSTVSANNNTSWMKRQAEKSEFRTSKQMHVCMYVYCI